jgi:hypothetical protein
MVDTQKLNKYWQRNNSLPRKERGIFEMQTPLKAQDFALTTAELANIRRDLHPMELI